MQGDSEEGIAVMREGMTAWRATGSRFRETYRLAQAAEAHLLASGTEAGLQLVPAAIDHNADRWLAPEIHRIRGELYRSADREEMAQECLQMALEGARTQEARLLELRAAVSLARLWRDRGKREEARELLAPVY